MFLDGRSLLNSLLVLDVGMLFAAVQVVGFLSGEKETKVEAKLSTLVLVERFVF